MRSHSSRMLCAILVVGVLGRVAAAAPPPSPQQLGQWVRDLNADHYTAREVASRRLAAAGEAAVDVLASAAHRGDAETAWRSRAILEQIALEGSETALLRVTAAFDQLSKDKPRLATTVGELKARQAKLRRDRAAVRIRALGGKLSGGGDESGFVAIGEPAFGFFGGGPGAFGIVEELAESGDVPFEPIELEVGGGEPAHPRDDEPQGGEGPAFKPKQEKSKPAAQPVADAAPARVEPPAPPPDAPPPIAPPPIAPIPIAPPPIALAPRIDALAPPPLADLPPLPAPGAEGHRHAEGDPGAERDAERHTVPRDAAELEAELDAALRAAAEGPIVGAIADAFVGDVVEVIDVNDVPDLSSGGLLLHEVLVLDRNWRGGDQGLAELADMPGIVNLAIQDAKLTDAALDHIAKLPRLADLSVRGASDISAEGLRSYRQKRPKTRIYASGDAMLGINASREGPCVLTNVYELSGAYEAGLRAGDEIVSVGGHATRDFSDLTIAVFRCRPGERVAVEYKRGGKMTTVQVLLKDRAIVEARP